MSKKNFSFLQLAAWLTVMLGPLVAFADEVAETAEGAEEAAAQSVNLIDLIFVKGGAFMYPIVLLSFYMVYLIIDAILVIRKKKLMPEDTVKYLRENFHKDKVDECEKYCQEHPCALTVVVGHAITAEKKGKGPLGMQEAVVEYGGRLANDLRARVAYLNTVATISPMLDLLGTVSGMIKAFSNIGASGVDKASALANNISEALITTAGGLVVAIPALAAFFFFRNRITETMVAVEDEIGELIEQF